MALDFTPAATTVSSPSRARSRCARWAISAVLGAIRAAMDEHADGRLFHDRGRAAMTSSSRLLHAGSDGAAAREDRKPGNRGQPAGQTSSLTDISNASDDGSLLARDDRRRPVLPGQPSMRARTPRWRFGPGRASSSLHEFGWFRRTASPAPSSAGYGDPRHDCSSTSARRSGLRCWRCATARRLLASAHCETRARPMRRRILRGALLPLVTHDPALESLLNVSRLARPRASWAGRFPRAGCCFASWFEHATQREFAYTHQCQAGELLDLRRTGPPWSALGPFDDGTHRREAAAGDRRSTLTDDGFWTFRRGRGGRREGQPGTRIISNSVSA